jgi:hypothetical protein
MEGAERKRGMEKQTGWNDKGKRRKYVCVREREKERGREEDDRK